MSSTKTKFGSLLLLLQGILLILFVVFVDYGDDFKPGIKISSSFNERFSAFQNLHIMAFLGFGLIGTFLRRNNRGTLVHAFLIGGLVIQWATLLQGFFTIKNSKVELSLDRMISADYAVLVVLISFGAVVGKANSLQLLIIALIETFFFSINETVCLQIFKVTDYGRSIIVHLFGSVFGVAVSRMLYSRKICMSQALSTSNKSEMYSLIGTIFLWIYWPSLNACYVEGSAKRRAIVNTYYALAASCISTFSFTVLQNEESRFNMLHLQNASLAGGIAIGAVAALLVRPWGAVIIGVVGSLSSVMGYKYLVPKLRRSFKIHDVRGINAAHGIPALVGGFASIVAACLATEEAYGTSLYTLYPGRTPTANSTKYLELSKISSKFEAGSDRTGYMQGVYQLIGMVVTLAISLVGGLLTGLTVRVKFFEPATVQDAFDDHNDFQEANFIDVCSDDEYEEDHEKHHDSVRGNKRLLDTASHNSDIVAGNNDSYAVGLHYGEITPASMRKSNHSIGGHHSISSSIHSLKDSKHSIENVVDTPSQLNKESTTPDEKLIPVENGVEMQPLILVEGKEEPIA